MKYKLINKTTGEEHICEKVVIDGWDYYVSNELPQKNNKILCDERNHITENPKYKIRTCKSIVNDWIMTFEIDGQGENPNWTKKVIATNNPSIDIPKVVDEVDVLGKTMVNLCLEKIKDLTKRFFWKAGFKSGYNKSQETHPFSEEDVKEIFKIAQMQKNYGDYKPYTFEETIQLWKEQRPKTLYYE